MWAAAAAVAAVAMPGAAQAGPSDAHAGTQALLNQELQVAPGAAVLAGDANGSWSLHAGTGQFGKNKPIQPTDHFRIGSQTKTFTAAVVLQLVDEGKITLDTPIENYLPGVVDGNGYDGNQITIRELLQHRTGIPQLTEGGQPNPNTPDGSYSLSELVRTGLKAKPDSAPDTKFEYSNINFNILGLLIEKVTGKPVGDAITQRVIQPLGLTDTSFPRGGDRALPEPYIHGYVVFTVGPINTYLDWTTSVEPSFYSNAGGMISTMPDLAAFYRALADGKVVSPSALAEMRKTVPWPGGPSAGDAYGLGYSSHPLSCGGLAWGHGGNVLGYATWTLTTDDGRYATMTANNTRSVKDNAGNDNRESILDSAICGH